jgi:pyruvate dehydrogenase E1 component alpha subunit
MDKELVVSLYRQMLRIRRFEEKLLELFSTRHMPGTMHQYNGQEAVAVGVCAHLREDDYITSTHRGHGHCLAKGVEMNRIMAEMFAKSTGCCRGMGGSMHIADFGVGMLGANGIVGGGIPIATGAAWACKYRKSGRITVSFFGDGAANEGAFHEAVNLAAIWQLPIVFACENNLYGFSTHYTRTIALERIADRAAGYGIPGESVDGMDVAAVHECAEHAVARARSGGGPTLLECRTYRFRGHSRFEDPNYRTREELEEWLKRDPIPALEHRLVSEYGVGSPELECIEQAVKEEIEAAVRFAVQSPEPEPTEFMEYVLA